MGKLHTWAVTMAAVVVGLSPGLAILSARPIARLIRGTLWPRPVDNRGALHRQCRHPESVFYRGSMAGLHVPCRRFADILADACARLGAYVGRYSFIAVDLHHLLLAGLPAHPCENVREPRKRRTVFSITFFG